MALPKGFDLEGWKEIAGHIGCAISTAEAIAERADDRSPLPVIRGYLGRTIAKRAELDAWAERETQLAAQRRRIRTQARKPAHEAHEDVPA